MARLVKCIKLGREMEGLDFRGALELLARKAGVDLSQYDTGRSAETGKLKERLF